MNIGFELDADSTYVDFNRLGLEHDYIIAERRPFGSSDQCRIKILWTGPGTLRKQVPLPIEPYL